MDVSGIFHGRREGYAHVNPMVAQPNREVVTLSNYVQRHSQLRFDLKEHVFRKIVILFGDNERLRVNFAGLRCCEARMGKTKLRVLYFAH